LLRVRGEVTTIENIRDFTDPANPVRSRPLVDADYFVDNQAKEAVRRSRVEAAGLRLQLHALAV
jgi:hypothetical protein